MYLFELCTNRFFMTVPGEEKTYDLGPSGGLDIGAYVEDLQVHVSGVNFTTNFQYKVLGGYSNDGGTTWTPFAGDVLSNYCSEGNKNSTPYTTRTDFGLLLRFQGGRVERDRQRRGERHPVDHARRQGLDLR